MPAAIESEIRKQVVRQWLSGDTRAKIAEDNGIGAGTVTNVVNDWKGGLDYSEYESVRELATYFKKQGLSLYELANRTRLCDYIKKLGADEEQIESFILNLLNRTNSLPPEKILEITNQLFEISKSISVPLAEIPTCLRQNLIKNKKIDEKIKTASAILESKQAEVQTMQEYMQLREELSKHHLSLEDPARLLTVLKIIKHYGYDPKKILEEFSDLRSLKQREKGLENNCRILENRAQRYQTVLPLAGQIAAMGIGIDAMLTFNVLVNETAETYHLPIPTAAFRVIKEIEEYRKVGGLKEEYLRLFTQVYTMHEISARQTKVMTAVFKLQCYGIGEDEIFKLCKFFENHGHNINLESMWANLKKCENQAIPPIKS
jgi:hypothetical protein